MSYVELRNTTILAKKDHSCEWCFDRIHSGETCRYRVYKFDGDFRVGYLHIECYEAMLKSDLELLACGWDAGEFKRGEVQRP